MPISLFSRLFLKVAPLVAALCVVVPAAGGRPLVTDEAWEQFGFSACSLPCFAGITPGRTPFQQTPTLLRRNIQNIQNRMFSTGTVVNFWASTEQYDLSGFTRHLWGVVDEIRLNTTVPLDHLIEQLGMPDCVLLSSPERHSPVMYWERRQIAVVAVLQNDADIRNLSARVPALWLHKADANECDLQDAVRWRGFAPMWDYLRARALDESEAASTPITPTQTALSPGSCC